MSLPTRFFYKRLTDFYIDHHSHVICVASFSKIIIAKISLLLMKTIVYTRMHYLMNKKWLCYTIYNGTLKSILL